MVYMEQMQALSELKESSSGFRMCGKRVLSFLKMLALKSITVGVIYVLGYFQIHPAWLLTPLIFSAVKDHWRSEQKLKQQIAMAFALKFDKQFVLENMEELPSWVHFSDIDQCEWLNKVLAQVWPNVSVYLMKMIKDFVEPCVQEVFSKSFNFDSCDIGAVPPRVGGIKVYQNNKGRKEVVMDVNIFYAGNCHFSFNLHGLNGGIEYLQLKGLLRIVLKPLITTIPFFGAVEIFFVKKPSIDFDLEGVADLLDFPGISCILHKIIDDQISSVIVLPNKISVITCDCFDLSEVNLPDPEGVLRVNVIEAKDLVNKDINVFGKDKSDPYILMRFGAQTSRSSVSEDTLDPKWDFWAEFVVDTLYVDFIEIFVLDKDRMSEDSPLGNISFDINVVMEKGFLDIWKSLENTKKGKVHVRMFYFKLSSTKSDYQPDLQPVKFEFPSMTSCLLLVYVDSVHNLISPRNEYKPDVVIHIEVDNNITQISKTVSSSNNPSFEEGFTFFVKQPEHDKLTIKLCDGKNNDVLGLMNFNIKQLLDIKSMEILNRNFHLLDTAAESVIVLSLRLRIISGTF